MSLSVLFHADLFSCIFKMTLETLTEKRHFSKGIFSDSSEARNRSALLKLHLSVTLVDFYFASHLEKLALK